MYSQFYLFVLLLLACLSSQDILTANGALWTYPAQALDTTSDNPSQNDVWKIGDQRTLTWNNYVDNADSITINLIQAQDNGAGFATQVIKSKLTIYSIQPSSFTSVMTILKSFTRWSALHYNFVPMDSRHNIEYQDLAYILSRYRLWRRHSQCESKCQLQHHTRCWGQIWCYKFFRWNESQHGCWNCCRSIVWCSCLSHAYGELEEDRCLWARSDDFPFFSFGNSWVTRSGDFVMKVVWNLMLEIWWFWRMCYAGLDSLWMNQCLWNWFGCNLWVAHEKSTMNCWPTLPKCACRLV